MSCAAMAAACSELSRTARIPPWTLGWSVFTRPSIISGKPVRPAPSRASSPASRKARAVPPVETSSTPCPASARPNSTSPVLSETERRARAIFTSDIVILRWSCSGGSLELPGDGHALGRRFAGDDELEGRMRPRLAVDPQTVLGRETGAATAELPDGAARRPEQSTLAIGGRGHLDRRRGVEAGRGRGGLAPPAGRPRGPRVA